jgi:hypothetical protein
VLIAIDVKHIACVVAACFVFMINSAVVISVGVVSSTVVVTVVDFDFMVKAVGVADDSVGISDGCSVGSAVGVADCSVGLSDGLSVG